MKLDNLYEIVPSTCWEWKGSIRQPTQRTIPRSHTESPKPRGPYKPTDGGDYLPVVTYQTQPIPLYNSKPARRVVYANHYEIPYEDVPTLRFSCRNPLCVNPNHTIPYSRPPVTLQELLEDQMPGVSIEFLRSEYPGRVITQEIYDEFQKG